MAPREGYDHYRAMTEHDVRFHDTVLALAGNDHARQAFARTHCHLHIFRLHYVQQVGSSRAGRARRGRGGGAGRCRARRRGRDAGAPACVARPAAARRRGLTSVSGRGDEPLPLPAEPVDLELDDVAGAEVRLAGAEPDARRRARVDEVAGLEHHELAEVPDHVRDRGRSCRPCCPPACVSPLTVSAQLELLRVVDLVRRSPATGRAG